MAKWGEGDPRWIVEDRPDSTNVNNWHWSELNCFSWAQTYVKDNLKGLFVHENGQKGDVTSVSDVKGDVSMANRKGKVRTFFDLTLTLELAVIIDGTPLKTTLTMNDVNQDEDADDYTVDLSTADADAGQKKKIREVVRALLEKIHDVLAVKMLADLRAVHEKKVLLPLAEGKTANGAAPAAAAPAAASSTASTAAAADKTPKGIKTSTVRLDVEMLASAMDVSQAFTDLNRVRIWTQSDATVTAKANTPFSFFGGNLSGEIQSLDPGRSIVMSWRVGSWPSGHHSTVTLTFEQGYSSTTVRVVQADVPADQADSTKMNWHRMVFDRMKQTFGWGFAHHEES